MDLVPPGDPAFVERRAMRRTRCALESTLRLRGRFAVAGRTADLTTHGARIDEVGPFPAGSAIWVRLPGLESLTGSVIWSRPGATGVAFEHPLHPAVHARFLPADCRLTVVGEAAAVAPVPAEIAVLPRREQIVRGYAATAAGPLCAGKQPIGGGLARSIRRSVVRRSEHRGEARFDGPARTGPMRLSVDQRAAEIRNLSASGLKIAGAFEAAVGSNVAVAFDGFDAMPGRVVWRCAEEMGLSLPRDSLALDDA